MRKRTVAVLLAPLLWPAIGLWMAGGPAEAWAIYRLDGVHLPLPQPIMSTVYPAAFTHAAFVAVNAGDSADSVRARLGDPVRKCVVWGHGRSACFEPKDGDWRSVYAYGVDVPTGTTLAALPAGWPATLHERWHYSAQEHDLASWRMRSVTLRAGRVESRFAGIWWD
jgi:hypothetical protein